jgi:hypothetical protein
VCNFEYKCNLCLPQMEVFWRRWIYHLLKASSYYEKKKQEMEEEKRIHSSLMAQYGWNTSIFKMALVINMDFSIILKLVDLILNLFFSRQRRRLHENDLILPFFFFFLKIIKGRIYLTKKANFLFFYILLVSFLFLHIYSIWDDKEVEKKEYTERDRPYFF